MREEAPLVSIIVRTKDRPELLKKALKSIADQTYRPIEVILVNDGGCELDIEELKSILGDVSLNYIRLENNTGRAHAGNVGIENARGEYIGFLDDDDEYYPEYIKTIVSFMKENDYRIAYVDAYFVYKSFEGDMGNMKEVKKEVIYSKDFDYDSLLFENYIPFNCLLFKRDVLIASGGLDPELEIYEDWDLLLRLGERYDFHHINRPLVKYQQWSEELQVSQRNRDYEFMKSSYLKVISKHFEKFTPPRIHKYVSDYSNAQSLLTQLKKDTGCIEGDLERKILYIANLESALKERNAYINKLESRLNKKDIRISELTSLINDAHSKIKDLEDSLAQREEYITQIHSGHGWRLLTKYYALRDRLFPDGTKRRLFVKLILKAIFNPRKILNSVDRTHFRKFINYLKTVDPFTIEKKIEQKLSDDAITRKLSDETGPIWQDTAKPMDRDYFTYLFDLSNQKSEAYVSITTPDLPKSDIRLIAFYLPQFHPIPENDEWWGKGFTEWANVTRAVPQFIGHYQPRLPGELGFYDLRISDIQKRQIELARQYGIYGFCFHFYWFNGKTLLEMPLKQFVEHFDFPFCLNWANENWTRRWDGYNDKVLISQKHSREDDIRFIEYISRYLRRDNYIRINEKPLIIIYRPSLLPNPSETAERWREWCYKNGIGEIYLALTHSFEHIDPRKIGFDAAIEFPPNTFPLRDISNRFRIINPDFKGTILDYNEAVEYSLNFYDKPSYKKFRGICPGWDNEARRPGRGTILANATPQNFKYWLKGLCDYTYDNFEGDEKLIFINAWNEWAEAAYLEPDRRYGYAYLQAVADALIEHHAERRKMTKILFVGHDAHYHGAQLILLHIIKRLNRKFNFDIHLILKSGGQLEKEYRKYAKVYNLERDYSNNRKVEKLIDRLITLGIKDAICSTVVTGDVVEDLVKKGFRVITLVHELPEIIREMRMGENAERASRYSHKIIFPSKFVKERFKEVAPVDEDKAVIRPQGLYRPNRHKTERFDVKRRLKEMFSIPADAKIVLGVGFGDYRKGIDLFVKVANLVSSMRRDIYFIWVGDIHIGLERRIQEECSRLSNVKLIGKQEDVSLFFAGADIYLLTSREDPFPTVVLEAMEVGLPVIGFEGAGGFTEVVGEASGVLVPYLDVNAMADALIQLVADPSRIQAIAQKASRLVEDRFNYNDYVYDLLGLLDYEYKKVSVIIPNYNYGMYIKGRIESILKQTYPIYEIIFLDDASTDNSLEIIEDYVDEELNIRLVRNTENSGSVFSQWVKGIRMARGDYIWIAEADDLCEERFLEELMGCFERDKEVVLAYCQSKQIDGKGRILADNYLQYTNDIDRDKWRSDYIRDGLSEITDTLAVKNTIPNASAVVFKKPDDLPIEDEIIRFKIVGDWFFYIWLLQHGKVAYISKSLNMHRRHEQGVTKSEDKELHFNEVTEMQDYVIKRFHVSEETRRKVFSYRRYLAEYFDLDHHVIKR